MVNLHRKPNLQERLSVCQREVNGFTKSKHEKEGIQGPAARTVGKGGDGPCGLGVGRPGGAFTDAQVPLFDFMFGFCLHPLNPQSTITFAIWGGSKGHREEGREFGSHGPPDKRCLAEMWVPKYVLLGENRVTFKREAPGCPRELLMVATYINISASGVHKAP